MKAPALVLYLSLILLTSAFAQNRNSDRQHDGLLGTVRSVRVESAELAKKSGKLVERRRVLNSTVTYDESGNILEDVIYDADGNPSQRRVYSPSANGSRNVTEQIMGGFITTKEPPKEVTSRKGGQPSAVKADDQIWNQQSVSLSKNVYKYKYDDRGNRVEEGWYSEQGALLYRIVYIYGDKGNITEETHYNRDSLNRKITYIYLNGNVIEEVRESRVESSGGSYIDKQSYKYSYEYDTTGNWIKRTVLSVGSKKGKVTYEPYSVDYRVITYY